MWRKAWRDLKRRLRVNNGNGFRSVKMWNSFSNFVSPLLQCLPLPTRLDGLTISWGFYLLKNVRLKLWLFWIIDCLRWLYITTTGYDWVNKISVDKQTALVSPSYSCLCDKRFETQTLRHNTMLFTVYELHHKCFAESWHNCSDVLMRYSIELILLA